MGRLEGELHRLRTETKIIGAFVNPRQPSWKRRSSELVPSFTEEDAAAYPVKTRGKTLVQAHRPSPPASPSNQRIRERLQSPPETPDWRRPGRESSTRQPPRRWLAKTGRRFLLWLFRQCSLRSPALSTIGSAMLRSRVPSTFAEDRAGVVACRLASKQKPTDQVGYEHMLPPRSSRSRGHQPFGGLGGTPSPIISTTINPGWKQASACYVPH